MREIEGKVEMSTKNARKSCDVNTPEKTGHQKSKLTRDGKIKMEKRGVILLSHLPRGFYEHQILSFFSQFGEVTRVKLVRSKKTGGPKHYAFVEFLYEEVAKVAADTMNFYFMHRKVMRCKFIAAKEVGKGTFHKWREIYVPKDNKKTDRQAYNKAMLDPEKIAMRKQRATKKRSALQKKLKSMGIDYDVINVKKNDSFIAPRRSRASVADVRHLWRSGRVRKIDSRCDDFEYSDDEQDYNDLDVSELPGTNMSEPKETGDEKVTEITMHTSEPSLDVTADSHQTTGDFNTMVVDSEEEEITFKTPPAEARIKRKTLKKMNNDARLKRQQMLQKLQHCLDSGDDST